MQCPHPMSVIRPGQYDPRVRITVPCGRCPICKSNRRQDWHIRLTEELKNHDSAVFVTLTYESPPYNVTEDGEICYSVRKRDVQLFIKRFRERINRKIKYYCVSEYGCRTLRPHNHLIMFSVSENDRDRLSNSWELGFVHVGKVTPKSIGYVCKYHVNKGFYPDGSDPPYALVSLGLGKSYVNKMREYHAQTIDRCYYADFEQKKRLPRYYKDKVYSTKQKEEFARLYQDGTHTHEKVENYRKKYPEGNYWKNYQDCIESFEKQITDKSKFNEKL